MSEILFLAHRVPYPPTKGDKIRSWQSDGSAHRFERWLYRSERYRGIHGSGSTSRQITRKSGREEQYDRHEPERERICRRDVEEQVLQRARSRNRCRQSEHHAHEHGLL